MMAIADRLVGLIWLISTVYWIAMAVTAKRTRIAPPAPQQLVHHALGATAVTLFVAPFRGTVLAAQVLSRTDLTSTIGLTVLILGAGFACWARAILGRNWSARVTIKEDHRLIRRGPYALARHPIYTGLLASVLGSAIVFGKLHHFVALAVAFAAYVRKSRLEELWLTQEFGAEYARYRREVRALVPYVF